jgi:hypothetical protein
MTTHPHKHESAQDTTPPIPQQQFVVEVDYQEVRRIANDCIATHEANQGNILERRLNMERTRTRWYYATIGLVTVLASAATSYVTTKVVMGRAARRLAANQGGGAPGR